MWKRLIIGVLVVSFGLFALASLAFRAFTESYEQSLQQGQLDLESKALVRQFEKDLNQAVGPETRMSASGSQESSGRISIRITGSSRISRTPQESQQHINDIQSAVSTYANPDWNIHNDGVSFPVEGKHTTFKGLSADRVVPLLSYQDAFPNWVYRFQIGLEDGSIAAFHDVPSKSGPAIGPAECAEKIRQLHATTPRLQQLEADQDITVDLGGCTYSLEPHTGYPRMIINARKDSFDSLVDAMAQFAEQSDPMKELIATAYHDGTLVVRVPISSPKQKPADPTPYQQRWRAGTVLIDHDDVRIEDGLPVKRKSKW